MSFCIRSNLAFAAMSATALAAMLSMAAMAAPLATEGQQARAQRPLDVADVLNVREINGDPAFHPTQDLVALTVIRRADAPPKRSVAHFLDNIDERGVSYFQDAARLVLVDLHKGTLQSIGRDTARSWSPVWSPDGSKLAFLSDADGRADLYVWHRGTGQSTRLGLPAAPVGSDRRLQPVWLPDSQRIIVATRRSSLPVEDGVTPNYGPFVDGRKVFTSPVPGDVDGNVAGRTHWLRADLLMVSLERGEPRRLAEGLSMIGFWLSPDGRQLAVEETLGAEPASQHMRSRFHFLAPSSGDRMRTLPQVLPGGYTFTSAAWTGDSSCFLHLHAGKVMKTCTQGGSLETRALDTGFAIERFIEADRAGGRLLAVAQDGQNRNRLIAIDGQRGTATELATSARHLFLDLVDRPSAARPQADADVRVVARDRETQEAVILQVGAAGRLDEVFRGPVAFASTRARWSADGQAYFAFLESPGVPPEPWRLESSGEQRNLSVLNDALEGRAFAKPTLLRTSQDPATGSQGVLLVPGQWRPGLRCPLIVRPYGNQRAVNRLYHFGVNHPSIDNLQLLASRGYAVLVPALPLEPGAPINSIREHTGALVDAAVAQGVADPDRLGLFGHSFGGYSAIGLATGSSPVFRSTVVTAPVGLNLFSYYGFMDEVSASVFIGWTEGGQSNVGANPWSDPSRLLQNSPLLQADRIQGPVLIVLGEADTPRVPQSDELYVALRRLGKRAEYRIYQREPHWMGLWSAQNAHDYLERVLGWFDETLGVRADGAAVSAGDMGVRCR